MSTAQLPVPDGVGEVSVAQAQWAQVAVGAPQLAATADLFKALGGGWDGLPDSDKSVKN